MSGSSPDLGELGAPVRGVLQQILFLDDVNDSRRDGAAQRVAAVGAAYGPWEQSDTLEHETDFASMPVTAAVRECVPAADR